MTPSLSESYRRALIGWTEGVRRFAWAVVMAAALSSVLAVNYLADNVRINTDTEDMLSPDLAFRRHSAEMEKAFPQFSDNIVVVIDGATPDLADDGARKLVANLRRQPKLFGTIQDIAGSDFFRRNGFLYSDLEDLYVLSDRMAEAQPFLGTLWRDPSLGGFFRMIGLVLDEILKGQNAAPIEIASVLDAVADVAEAQGAGRFQQLSWQDLMAGAAADDEKPTANRRVLVIQPALDFATLAPAAEVMAALRALARDLELVPENGVRVRLTGSAALAHEELESVEKGMGLAGGLSLVLVICLLTIGLRSKRLVAATLVTLAVGLIWTAAFAILALGTLNLISVAFAVLFIGLSVDFGIHYGLRYQEAIDAGNDHGEALTEAAGRAGGALTLCAVSAAIAFYSFLPTDYLGLAELGLIAGTGMFIAFFANITVLPALLTLMPKMKAKKNKTQSRFAPIRPLFRSFIHLNSRAVCWGALAVGLAAALALPKINFDFDPLNLKDPKAESVATIFDLMADNRTSPYTVSILSPDLAAARALVAKLEALPEVDGAGTVDDYVPKDQAEKLEVISTMGLFLLPSLTTAGKGSAPALNPEEALRAFRQKLERFASIEGKGAPEQTKAAKRLAKALDGLFGKKPDLKKLAQFEDRLLSALPGRLAALKAALEAEPVSLKTLPADITAGQIAKDGRVKIEVYPKENLRNRDALKRFVAAVQGVAANASGSSVVILEAGNAVITAFWQAGAISIFLISILLLAVLRRITDAAMVFAPLLLAGLLTVAASVVFGLAFNFANLIVLPLLFGLGVASGIHLVLREREEKTVNGVLETSTPRAVVFSALTTIGSFGSIAMSSHQGTSSMGVLLTVAISLTLVCTLVVLPALVAVTGIETRQND